MMGEPEKLPPSPQLTLVDQKEPESTLLTLGLRWILGPEGKGRQQAWAGPSSSGAGVQRALLSSTDTVLFPHLQQFITAGPGRHGICRQAPEPQSGESGRSEACPQGAPGAAETTSQPRSATRVRVGRPGLAGVILI